jgi:hypothetical protein
VDTETAMAMAVAEPSPETLLQQFASEAEIILGVAPRPVTLSAFDVCPTCRVTLRYNQALQQLVCPTPSCGHWKRFADMTSSALAYGEEVQFIQYAYKPVSHLDDIMKFAEASESLVVPVENLVKVMERLRAMGITNPEDITIPMVRRACKDVKVKMDNSVQIYSRLTGRAPRRMTPFMKDQMRIMFHAAEGAFRKHAAGRTNHLSFPFTLRKYCELLGYWEMLDSLPMLRCQNNVHVHDAIMSRVFNDMGWSFSTPIHKEGPRLLGSKSLTMPLALPAAAMKSVEATSTLHDSKSSSMPLQQQKVKTAADMPDLITQKETVGHTTEHRAVHVVVET